MKKLILFFVLLYLFGCSGILDKNSVSNDIICPTVFFSSENSLYINGEIDNFDFEKIKFKASLNNYKYNNKCNQKKEGKNFFLDILIVAEPINPENAEINLPLFALIYDNRDIIIDKQYFKISGKFIYNQNESKYLQTDIVDKINIFTTSNQDVNYITIGFVNLK